MLRLPSSAVDLVDPWCQPLTLPLAESGRWLGSAYRVLFCICLSVGVYLTPVGLGLWALCVLAAGLLEWRRRRFQARWHAVRLLADGSCLLLDRNGIGHAARLLPSMRVWTPLIVLRVAVASMALTVVVTPRVMPADSFRRLRARLVWRRFTGTAPP